MQFRPFRWNSQCSDHWSRLFLPLGFSPWTLLLLTAQVSCHSGAVEEALCLGRTLTARPCSIRGWLYDLKPSCELSGEFVSIRSSPIWKEERGEIVKGSTSPAYKGCKHNFCRSIQFVYILCTRRNLKTLVDLQQVLWVTEVFLLTSQVAWIPTVEQMEIVLSLSNTSCPNPSLWF